jgi:hypothetical protein
VTVTEGSALLSELAGAGGTGGTGGTGTGEGGAAGGGAALPAWLSVLPAEVRTDDFVSRLGRYQTPEALGKAVIETQDWARNRVALPKDGDDVSRREFYAKVRPEKADDYKIALPDGMETSPLAEAFRPFAHDIGLNTHQAEALSQFINQQTMDQISQTSQAGTQEVIAFKLEVGESGYAQRTEAIANMIAASGIDGAEFLPALEKTQGAGKALRFLSWVAEKTGELHKIDGDQVNLSMGQMSVTAATQKLDALGKDTAFMAKARVIGSPEWKLRDDLMMRQAQG